MIHISSWPAATIDLMRVALPLLRDDGVLVMHGTHVVDGENRRKQSGIHSQFTKQRCQLGCTWIAWNRNNYTESRSSIAGDSENANELLRDLRQARKCRYYSGGVINVKRSNILGHSSRHSKLLQNLVFIITNISNPFCDSYILWDVAV